MPELPEVHTIASDLKKHIAGHTILDVEPVGNYKISGDYSKLINSEITNVTRIAKNIVIETNLPDTVLVIHLAMTGRVLVTEPLDYSGEWVRVVFRLSKDTTVIPLIFSDMRMFGKVTVINREELEKLQNKYGIEPISPTATADKFFEALKSKNTIIKNALLDQSIVAGLGNIYASDAMFLAGIRPETMTKAINYEEASKLFETAKQVLKEGIEKRGSTLPDKMYVDIFGNEGKYQENFKIYMQKKCPTCKTGVVYKRIQGRGSYFCPKCQPIKIIEASQMSLL